MPGQIQKTGNGFVLIYHENDDRAIDGQSMGWNDYYSCSSIVMYWRSINEASRAT